MSNHTPNLCVIDSDRLLAPQYQNVADRLGLQLQFYDRATQFLADQEDDSVGCLVVSIRPGETQLCDTLMHISQQQLDLPQIVAVDQSLAQATIDLVGPGTVSLRKLPFDFAELEQLVVFAIAGRQARLNLKFKREDFVKTVAQLTDRQRRIMDLISASVPNKAIATQLGVSQRTIESDRAIILRMFGAETAIDLAIRIGEYRLLEELAIGQSSSNSPWTQRHPVHGQPAEMPV
jgi:two-component system CheB/CheR fusion protein